MQSLVDDVIAFNRTSCALSNFPDEQSPVEGIYADDPQGYRAAAWQNFFSRNRVLVEQGCGQSQPRNERGQIVVNEDSMENERHGNERRLCHLQHE